MEKLDDDMCIYWISYFINAFILRILVEEHFSFLPVRHCGYFQERSKVFVS